MRLQLQIGALCVAAWLMAACSAGSTTGVNDARLAGRGQSDARAVYQVELERARAQRLTRLRAPDGWLSYTGSGRVRAGQYRVGSDPQSDIVL
ncbi:lipoprotein, partial [Xanthomonas hortorum pv. gardneri]